VPLASRHCQQGCLWWRRGVRVGHVALVDQPDADDVPERVLPRAERRDISGDEAVERLGEVRADPDGNPVGQFSRLLPTAKGVGSPNAAIRWSNSVAHYYPISLLSAGNDLQAAQHYAIQNLWVVGQPVREEAGEF
jgi:hypothetical protein